MPSWASLLAAARPMPLVPPVISAVDEFELPLIFGYIWFSHSPGFWPRFYHKPTVGPPQLRLNLHGFSSRSKVDSGVNAVESVAIESKIGYGRIGRRREI